MNDFLNLPELLTWLFEYDRLNSFISCSFCSNWFAAVLDTFGLQEDIEDLALGRKRTTQPCGTRLLDAFSPALSHSACGSKKKAQLAKGRFIFGQV